MEPFKIKAVEPIRLTTREERAEHLERAHYNIFLLPAEDDPHRPADRQRHRRR